MATTKQAMTFQGDCQGDRQDHGLDSLGIIFLHI